MRVFTPEQREHTRQYMKAYHAKRRAANMVPVRTYFPQGICSVDGCDKPARTRGLCDLHNQRRVRTGSTDETPRTILLKQVVTPDGMWSCPSCKRMLPRTSEFFGITKAYAERKRQPGRGLFDGMRWDCRKCSNLDVQRHTCKVKYGISLEQRQKMLDEQDGKCASCARDFEDLTGRKRGIKPNVDHCHSTGKVRGLLCHNCNIILGFALDNPEALRKAAAYLERSAATTIH